MLHNEALGPLLGAIALGAVHGIEPGHGWPVAASYALDQANKWLYGFAASVILGLGHLVSSIAMVGAFFYAKSYFNLTQVNEPITILGGIQINGPVSIAAGVLLVALGVREYFHGHSHGSHRDDQRDGSDHHCRHSHAGEHGTPHEYKHKHGHSNDDDHELSHDDAHVHGHSHHHGQSHHHGGGLIARLKGFVPFVGGHSHSRVNPDEAADRGLLGIAWFAFVLGFAHEEEFEIIALCAGSTHCLELMSAYAITVVVGIVGLTMLLIAGYQHHEETVERYTPYLPAFSATVLVLMGGGFIVGLF
ncbi:hypothetical protein [Haloprofundus salilacus]|uniref:hypothetical protein n=1 Tax=Haloprofundus salilacus TaxID=2876190 RepID=UPI001CCA8DA7|nr:hypothetical protein [Haloprofundus salilacus]